MGRNQKQLHISSATGQRFKSGADGMKTDLSAAILSRNRQHGPPGLRQRHRVQEQRLCCFVTAPTLLLIRSGLHFKQQTARIRFNLLQGEAAAIPHAPCRATLTRGNVRASH